MEAPRGRASPLARSLDEIRWPHLETLRTLGAGPLAEVVLHGPLVFGPRADPRAFDALLQDVAALANASGGDVLAGTIPAPSAHSRVLGWRPIAECARAAAHLERLARERIEPRIPRLQVRGIARPGSPDGVLLIRVPRSRLAPHRLEPHGEVYVREAGCTRELDTREAQAIAFRIARETTRVESRLDELARRGEVLTRAALPRLRDAHAVRVSAVPTATIEIPREWLWRRREPFDTSPEVARPWRRRPVLGGISWRFGARPERARVEMFGDGAVSFWTVGGRERAAAVLAPTLARATIALVDALRACAQRPRLEYALQVQLYDGAAELDAGLPLYSLGEPGRASVVLELLAKDLATRAAAVAQTSPPAGTGVAGRNP